MLRLLQAIAVQRLPKIKQETMLLHGTVVIGNCVKKAFSYKLLLLLVIMYAKKREPQIDRHFLSELHIQSQDKNCL